MDKPLDNKEINQFIRSLTIRPRDLAQIREYLRLPDPAETFGELATEYSRLAEILQVRRQIDRFLQESADPDSIMALLLTIATNGGMFAFNRAFILLKDPDDGLIRSRTGIGSLNREEAWHVWGRIHQEMLDFEQLLRRARSDANVQRDRLRPLLDRLCFDPAAECRLNSALCGHEAVVFEKDGANPSEDWLFDALGVSQVGVIPMWGPSGFFGDILLDNFATGRPITRSELRVLGDFANPFIGSLEKTLILERYRAKVNELQAAYDRIDAQKEMMVKMEKRAALGRYSSILAHNLINPLMAMAGHVGRLRNGGKDAAASAQTIADLQADMQKLEDFVNDIISHVETKNPGRHFWDINHLIGEAVHSFGNHDPLHPPDISVEEGIVPLVHLDYNILYEALVRLIGLLIARHGRETPVRIQTRTSDDSVEIIVEVAPHVPLQAGEEEVAAREVGRITAFLNREGIALEAQPSGVLLRVLT